MGIVRRTYRFDGAAPELAVVRAYLEERLGAPIELRLWESGGGGSFSSLPRRARVDVQIEDQRVILEELLPLSELLFEQLEGALRDLGGVAVKPEPSERIA